MTLGEIWKGLARAFGRPAATLEPIRDLEEWMKHRGVAGWGVGPADPLEVAAVWEANRVIIDGLISMPLKLMRRAPAGGHIPATDDYRYRLMHARPNPAMTRSSWFDAWLLQTYQFGTGFAEIVRDGSGRVQALWPLKSGRITREKDDPDGTPRWGYPGRDGRITSLSDRDVLRLPLMTRDGIRGLDRTGLAARELAVITTAADVVRGYFANGAFPSGVVKRPAEAPKLSPEARDRLVDYVESFRGGGAGKFLMLEEGTAVERWQDSPDKAMPHEVMSRAIREVARRFGVPLPKLQDWERATWSNATEADRAFFQDTLSPLSVRITEELNAKLLLPREHGELSFEFVWQGILRSNPNEQADTLRKLAAADLLSVDEGRGFLNLPALGGEAGGRRYRPVNLTVSGHLLEFGKAGLATGAKAAAPQAQISIDLRRAAQSALEPVVLRALRRARHVVESKVRKGTWDDDAQRQLAGEQAEYLRTEIAGILDMVQHLGGHVEDAVLESWLTEWSEVAATEEQEPNLAGQAAGALLHHVVWR